MCRKGIHWTWKPFFLFFIFIFFYLHLGYFCVWLGSGRQGGKGPLTAMLLARAHLHSNRGDRFLVKTAQEFWYFAALCGFLYFTVVDGRRKCLRFFFVLTSQESQKLPWENLIGCWGVKFFFTKRCHFHYYCHFMSFWVM